MEENNGKTKLENRLTKLETSLIYITSQVDNHLPTQIGEVKKEVKESINDVQKAIDNVNTKLWGVFASILLMVITLVVTLSQR